MGNERLKETHSSGGIFKETRNINIVYDINNFFIYQHLSIVGQKPKLLFYSLLQY